MKRREVLPWLAALAAPRPARAESGSLLTPEERAWVAAHEVVLYAPERDFPPYSFVDRQGQHRGLSADLIDLLHASTGLKFQAVAAGDRATNLDRIKRREIDLVTSAKASPERESYLGFTSAYVSSPAVLLRRRNDPRNGDLANLGNQRVGVDRASALAFYLRGRPEKVTLVESEAPASSMQQLVFGDVDAVALNLATAAFVIDRDHLSGIRVAGEIGYTSTLSFGYRKDWPMLGRVLEKGLAQVTEAQRSALLERWVPLSDAVWWQRPEVQRILGATALGVGMLLAGLLLWNRTLRRAVDQQTEALRKELEERQRLEQRLRLLAEHDALTGLMNRAALTESLRRSLALAARQHWSVAVIFIDLDRFKQINDTYGHATGDEVLRQVASRLAACLRESDLLGRLGGDEFIVVAEALYDGPRNAIELSDKLLVQMKRVFMVDGLEIHCGFSAGIAIYPGDGQSPEGLIANADAAMYQAKAQGRYRAALFQPALVAAPLQEPRVVPGETA